MYCLVLHGRSVRNMTQLCETLRDLSDADPAVVPHFVNLNHQQQAIMAWTAIAPTLMQAVADAAASDSHATSTWLSLAIDHPLNRGWLTHALVLLAFCGGRPVADALAAQCLQQIGRAILGPEIATPLVSMQAGIARFWRITLLALSEDPRGRLSVLTSALAQRSEPELTAAPDADGPDTWPLRREHALDGAGASTMPRWAGALLAIAFLPDPRPTPVLSPDLLDRFAGALAADALVDGLTSALAAMSSDVADAPDAPDTASPVATRPPTAARVAALYLRAVAR
ncbi:hypothetical protein CAUPRSCDRAFT_12818, partial [Caulochytrium protostelioides]